MAFLVLGTGSELTAAPDQAAPDPLGAALARATAELAGPKGHPLQIDAGLARAATRFAQVLAAHAAPGTLDEARATLRAEGLAEAQLLPYSAAGPDPAQLAAGLRDFAKDIARPRGLSHVGIASLKVGAGYYLVALFTRRVIYLQPLADQERIGNLTVRGKARGPVEGLLLGPCPADGQPCRKAVNTLSVKRRGDGLTVVVPLPGEGLYLFELVLTSERGPEIGALWTFAVGVPFGPVGVEVPSPGPATAKHLVQLIAEARSAADVGPLTIDPRLTRAAEAHAKTICETRIGAHVIAGRGPRERAHAEGYDGTLAENLAISDSVGRAHTQLLLSPGHRRNVLDPLSTLVGVGVVEHPGSDGGHPTVCVVELYGR